MPVSQTNRTVAMKQKPGTWVKAGITGTYGGSCPPLICGCRGDCGELYSFSSLWKSKMAMKHSPCGSMIFPLRPTFKTTSCLIAMFGYRFEYQKVFECNPVDPMQGMYVQKVVN